MSAITGIFYRDGRSIKPDKIKKMNNSISHRGPDGSAVWVAGSIAFGHQMLCTTPESLHEKLPFQDEQTGFVITADARIDNRKELSEELDIRDSEDVSDSYFILKSYEKWGEKCPEHLLGDFAFAIWDSVKEQLFCARDHMGVKPFYYYLSEELFVFSTEIKALFSITDVPVKLNEKKIAYFLLYVTTEKKSTFYENIFTLIGAHSLNITYLNCKKSQYWKLDPTSEIEMDSLDDYFIAFQNIFRESVKCRLRNALPVGFELSGGLDSSSIVCMSKNILNSKKPIETYSYIFNNFPQSDERYFIKKVIETGGINPHFIYGDKIGPFEKIGEIFSYFEQPFNTPYLSILWNLYEKMQDNHIRIALSGLGGDNVIFRGYNYLSELAVTFKWNKLIKELYYTSKKRNISFYDNFKRDFVFPLIPEYLKKGIRPYMGINSGGPRHLKFFNDDFANKLSRIEYPANIRRKNIKPYNAKSYHYYLINTVSSQSTLEMMDQVSSAFKIEPRYPFFDKRLIEFCFAIPNDVKYRNGWDRFIERSSLEILPLEVQWRPQKAFLDPVLRQNLILFEKNSLEMLIYKDNQKISKYVDINQLKNIYQKYCNDILKDDEDIWFLWSILLLNIWLKKV